MLVVLYVASLVLGGVLLVGSLLLGGKDADGGLDAGQGGSEGGAAHEGGDGHDPGTTESHGDPIGFLTIFVSMRFWTFFTAFFGLTGVLLDGLGLVGSHWVSLPLALLMGFACGVGAAAALRWLGRDKANSAASTSDYVGQPARVLVAVRRDAPGKVRLQVKGSTIDLLALPAGDRDYQERHEVTVVSVEGSIVRVDDMSEGRRYERGSALRRNKKEADAHELAREREPSLMGSLLEDTSLAWLIVLGAAAVAVGTLVLISIVRKLLYIARPNEALIFSGKKHRTEDGQDIGFRIVTAGRRAFRIPVLETVNAMDMRIIPTDVVVQNAYSQGNIPLRIHAIANVKIHSDPRYLRNATERFLGQNRQQIQLVAQQTLEGALREVLAQLTPEQVNEDRLSFAQHLMHAAEDDLNKLGLELDTLKIQHVADDTGYLDSLGRPRIASALRDAENAESKALQEITQAQAIASQRAEVAKASAETQVLQKRNELRRVQAELEGEAQSVEREAEAAAKTARAEAERELQALRNELEQKRLQAEVVIPAEVQRHAREILAKGDAAPVVESGRAEVEVLRLLGEAWRTMGPEAKELYVIQHLEEIVGSVVDKMRGLKVDEVHVIDQGDGSGLASYAAAYPKMVAEVMTALRSTTGIDVPRMLESGGAR